MPDSNNNYVVVDPPTTPIKYDFTKWEWVDHESHIDEYEDMDQTITFLTAQMDNTFDHHNIVYGRDADRHRIAVVCIAVKDEIVCKGVSICSDGDEFDPLIGRCIAMRRLLKAFHKKESGDVILRDIVDDDSDDDEDVTDDTNVNQFVKYSSDRFNLNICESEDYEGNEYKSIYDGSLTEFETRCLYPPEHR